MKRAIPIQLLQGLGLGSLLLLSACGKREAAAPPPASSTAATPAPAASTRSPAAASTAPAAPVAPASSAKPAPASTTASAASSPTTVPFAFSKLTLGDAVNASHEVTHAAARFAPDDKTLFATVATIGSSSGATLNAKWSYLEGAGQLVSNISQSIATDGPAITTFKVQNPDLWPPGKYKVEISLDGKPVANQEFEIAKR